ncbi:MAG: ATP-binding domain-containing protein, partial [Sporomusaceae bacterium]|nr:ATP-binding domain-containing protein [Sporomusaceae bacterium]
NISYNERIKTLIGYIKFRVRNFLDVLEARQKQAAGSTDKKFEQYRSQGIEFLARYFSEWLIVDVVAFYMEVFRNKSSFKMLKNKKYDLIFITEYSLGILGEGEVEREDLAPLCYLKYLLDGLSHITKFEHIVVDEAQDLNALEFTILRLLSRNSSFTIMGDMSQGINSYRSIDSWQVLMKDVFSDVKSIYREVNHSYRSAREIVECFNSVMPSGHSLAIPVYEIGQKPVIEQVVTNQDAIRAIVEAVKKFKNLECKSIGIITKLESESLIIYKALDSDHFAIDGINLITSETLTYQGGISILPVTLAKGLEFDGVIIWNASSINFRDNSLDHKLLYVALSRALYYLHILYRNNLTPLLKKYTE